MEKTLLFVLFVPAVALRVSTRFQTTTGLNRHEKKSVVVLQNACVFPNRTVLAQKSAQPNLTFIEGHYDMGVASYSNNFGDGHAGRLPERAGERLLQVNVLEDVAFEEARRGLSHESRDAVIRGAYGIGLNFWHTTLEGPWGLEMWNHLQNHATPHGSCPNVDLILANTCLSKRGERSNACFVNNRPWNEGYDFLYAHSIVVDLKKNVKTFWDMNAGICYDRVFVGAPKLHYPFDFWEKQRNKVLMDGFGDCVMTRWQGTQRKDANAENPSILLVQRNATCKRHVTNFEDLVTTVVQRGFKKVTSVDLGSLTREKQLKTVSNADIMIQPHGAGLGWMSAMPKGGVVMEFNNQNPANYRTWAHWNNNIHYVEVRAEQDGTISDCKSKGTEPSIQDAKENIYQNHFLNGQTGNENPMRVPVERFMAGLDQALAMLGQSGLLNGLTR